MALIPHPLLIRYISLLFLTVGLMKIIELELLSDNIAQTEAFYKKVLGLSVSSTFREELTYNIGYTKLIFRKSENIKPVYHFAIDVPNNRFEDAYRHIRTGTEIIRALPDSDVVDFTNWDAKSFYFYDNNGNIVEIITRYANAVSSDAPFNPKSYVSVSEIGFVTNNVPELADRLITECGTPIFHRQPRGERFTVCGDDDGLFILAEKGRDWFPTTVKARSFRTRIVYYDRDVVSHIIR